MIETEQHPLAAVTGASTGIGAALAEGLARRRHALLLVAKPGEHLRAHGEELAARHGVAVDVRELDLTDPDARGALCGELTARPVSVLCNNAGVGTFGPFVEAYTADQIRLDVLTVAELTAAVLPGMLERRAGGLLMVGSTAGNQPVPGAATYAACKAFVNTLAESLHAELAGTGVRCTLLAPGPVRTAFAGRAGVTSAAARIPGFAWVSAEQAAEEGLAGLERGKRRVTPGLQGTVFDLGGRLAPQQVLAPLLRHVITRNV